MYRESDTVLCSLARWILWLAEPLPMISTDDPIFNSCKADNILRNWTTLCGLVHDNGKFSDAIREVRKYSANDEVDLNTNPQAETLIHMKLFRAQRNFYIAGFALFLFLWVILVICVNPMVHVVKSWTRSSWESNDKDREILCYIVRTLDLKPMQMIGNFERSLFN